MNLAYLAGPIDSDPDGKHKSWYDLVAEQLPPVWVAFNPRTAWIGSDFVTATATVSSPVSARLTEVSVINRLVIRRSRVVIARWPSGIHSLGTAREIECARQAGVPVVLLPDTPWIGIETLDLTLISDWEYPGRIREFLEKL